ncbi:MAG: hypothetical protein U9Q76_08520 [candidate division WOR-3 bacterium]|nr:hypothetical protein [candidate division WOR-3 bacterium]
MKPLWKILSGKFAGWRVDELLYNANGKHVGYFDGNIAYSLSGKAIGEIYEEDWIGKQTSIAYPVVGPIAQHANIGMAPYANRAGLAIAGWVDPDF